ncbi:MAG: hypothetical protein ABIS84_09840 [Arachnia sp.]
MTTKSLKDHLLWRELERVPDVVEAVVQRFASPDAALREVIDIARDAERVVVTGNGAAFYAGLALQSAARLMRRGPSVCAVSAGVVAAGGFVWRAGDLPLIISASGELGDMVDAMAAGIIPDPIVLTATPESSLAKCASATIVVTVFDSDAVTHTQAYIANVLTSLLFWEAVTGEELPLDAATLPTRLRASLCDAGEWAVEAASLVDHRRAGIVLASSSGWSTALQTALLMKEVAGLTVEGLESREAATTGMYALTPDHLVLSHAVAGDAQAGEAERVCGSQGALVIRLPEPPSTTFLELPITAFPASVALAAELGLRRGRDIDNPRWASAYYTTARTQGA